MPKDLSYEIYLRQHKDNIFPPPGPQPSGPPQGQPQPQGPAPSTPSAQNAPVETLDLSGIKEVLPAGVLYFFASDTRAGKFRFIIADLQKQLWALIYKERSLKAYVHDFQQKQTFWYNDPSGGPQSVDTEKWNDFARRAKECLDKINASNEDSRIIAPKSFLTSQGVPNNAIAIGSGILSKPNVISICKALYPEAELGLAQGMPISLVYSTEPPK